MIDTIFTNPFVFQNVENTIYAIPSSNSIILIKKLAIIH